MSPAAAADEADAYVEESGRRTPEARPSAILVEATPGAESEVGVSPPPPATEDGA